MPVLPPSVRPDSPPPSAGRPSTPAQAWTALVEGNERFAVERSSGAGSASRRAELVTEQRPFALVVGCSDSRVPAEFVFDADLGDLFVVRTAGHVVDAAVLGSVEYGVEVLGVPLVVVLGHERCGAVAAALDALDGGSVPGGYVRDIVERVAPSILVARQGRARDDDPAAEAAIVGASHVRATASLLSERSAVLSRAVAEGRAAVVGAAYELATGRVSLLEGADAVSAS